ncbi:MAG TPA: tetratricopeptide repeat protein [Pyrinomonadaceae bacterium]|jgi:tetratricopeptide (TPR) repeat protein
MKKGFIILFLTGFLFFQINCSKSASNQNLNAQTPAAKTETAQTTPTPKETPLPTFTDADTAFAEGNKLFDANEIDKAIEAYEQAVKLNPDFGEAYFQLGISYAILEKAEETLPANEPVVEQASPTPAPKKSKNKKGEEVEVVRTKKSEKAFENAVKVYKKYLVKNPKDDSAHFFLGRSYDKLNEDPDALKSFREAVKLKSDNSEYQTELGKILMKLAQYDEAVRALKKAIELDENNLLAEELLEKAEDGARRIDFAKREIQKQEDREKPVMENSKQPKPSPSPNGSPVPPVKPANANTGKM